ncbi:hypothetical protein KGF56_004739 [Candida oxycetoniae]|uniref:Mitochondrial inner membrane protease subunit n=1 Tax=Candida oxycetoniae TaxID=497107 RepID=A0AAI9WVP7_9ASCO|nr:uncharacterized protein KGF56_004739 [Candida oxycetoniae]KAI3402498.2 hypothetical protein KGF56_004739 [Candida oxycetoniae]
MPLNKSLRTTLLTLTWLPVLYTFTNHGYQPYQIKGSSMTPAFNPGTSSTTRDIVLVQKFDIKSRNDSIAKGDIIMFRSPLDPEKLLTKRVIGVNGDHVHPRSPRYPKSEVKIPRNHLWVEGDNSFHSVDSNEFGPISKGLVVGKVVMVLWPPSRLGQDLTRSI